MRKTHSLPPHRTIRPSILLIAFILGLLLASPLIAAGSLGSVRVALSPLPYQSYLPNIRMSFPPGPLVARYVNNNVVSTYYPEMRYQPRQFVEGAQADPVFNDARIDEPGPYAGWDVFSTPNSGINTVLALDEWLTIHLNRPATLAVVWRAGDPLPAWIQSWERGSDVILNAQPYPTYIRRFENGAAVLGSVYDPQTDGGLGPKPRPTYLVLFGEFDGSAPLPPTVPQGYPLPQPNETCPAWVHDQYEEAGPDGQLYRTWHPQIQPLYWCYFRHEHGSDPALFDSDAPVYFDYAPQKMGMSEPHEGYKVYVFDDLAGHTWLVTQHMGTSGLGRVCTRFHSLSMAAKDNLSGELLFSVHFLGDYGKSVINTTAEPLVPPTCPNQAVEAGDSTGVRQFGVATHGGISYEPWRVDGKKLVFGLQTANFLTNAQSSTATICDDVACAQMIPTGRKGEFRLIQWSQWQLGFQANEFTGIFYTDSYGRQLRESGAADAVQQFVRPGVDINAPPIEESCLPDTPWQVFYSCDGQNENVNNVFDLEGALKLPN